jgi:glycosyltransferase involved in cell wall biosynthesis
MGIPPSVPLVGVVARLTPDKNVSLFLEAAALVVGRGGQDAWYVVVGDGPLRGSLESRAERLGIAQRVVFAGYRLDMNNVYSDLDIVVLSSDNDGTPMSLLEAMACGKPVVATDVGGVGDCVAPDCGLLVPQGDAAAMAAALEGLLSDPHRRQTMGERGRETIRTQRSWEAMIDAHDSLYRRLLAAKVGSRP